MISALSKLRLGSFVFSQALGYPAAYLELDMGALETVRPCLLVLKRSHYVRKVILSFKKFKI